MKIMIKKAKKKNLDIEIHTSKHETQCFPKLPLSGKNCKVLCTKKHYKVTHNTRFSKCVL